MFTKSNQPDHCERSPAEAVSLAVVLGSVSRNAGGLFNSVRGSAIALSDAGCNVAVYSLADVHADEDLTAWRPLAPHVFPVCGPRAIGFAPGLGAALRERDPDLVHQHGLWQYLSAQVSAWGRRTGQPVVISPRGMLDAWALRNSGWKKRIARVLFEDSNLRGAACLHALNAAEAESIRALGLTNPIAVIPNGTDLPELKSCPTRAAWLPDDGRQVLLFLGRLHPKKGLKELLEAWALLKRDAPGIAQAWRLIIAGWDDGGHEAELKRCVAELEITNDVIFSGPLYDSAKAAVLANADAFILPSFSEGLPMAVLEAWSYQLPVFMTAACNLPEGFAVGAAIEVSTDSKQLANALGVDLGSGDLAEMGSKGRALVKARYTWESVAADLNAVYAWLAHGGPPPTTVWFD